MTTYYVFHEECPENAQKVEVVQQGEHFLISIDGSLHEVDARHVSDSTLSIINDHKSYRVKVIPAENEYTTAFNDKQTSFRLSTANPRHRVSQTAARKSGRMEIRSPMPGKVIDILVSLDQHVNPKDGLVVIEAMKMENEIKSPVTGTIKEINVMPGDTVSGNQVLIVMA